MDPISSIVGLVAIGAHLSVKVTGLVGEFRSAPAAIMDLSKELSALCRILSQLDKALAQRFGSKLPFSTELNLDLQDVLNNCHTAFKELSAIMQKFEKREKGEAFAAVLRRVQWMIIEGDIIKIRASLERHKTTLNVTLLLVVKYVAYLHLSASQISDDTARIKEVVEQIKLQLNLGESSEGSSDIVKEYLESVISEPALANSSCNPEPRPTLTDSFEAPNEKPPPRAHKNHGGVTNLSSSTESDHIASATPEASSEVNPPSNARTSDEATLGSSNSTGGNGGVRDTSAEASLDEPRIPDPTKGISPRKEYGSDEGDGGPLAMAANSGDSEMVQLLLDFGTGVNARGGDYGTALQAAAVMGHNGVVRLLLDRGADPNIQAGRHNTALRAALVCGANDVVLTLLREGADPKVGETLQLAADKGDDNAIRYLLDAGADINSIAGNYATALQFAAVSGNATTVSLLLARGADPNVIGGFDRTALRAAVGRKYDTMAQELLKAGADPNSEGALHLAAQNGNDDAINYLLDAGADVNATAGHYGTALEYAAINGKATTVSLLLARGADTNTIAGFERTALRAAVAREYNAMVQELLKAGADPNSEGALHLAAEKGNDNATNYLLDAGADINATAGHYGTALEYAAINGRATTVSLLLTKGADTNIIAGFDGTALRAAVAREYNAVAQELLRAGADPNSEGVLHLAAEKGNDNAISYLLDAGADINATAGHYGTALEYAAINGRATTISLLLAKGADTNVIAGFDGTALRAAVAREYNAVAQELLRAGADPNSEGVLHLAAEKGNDNAISYLLDAGADINATAGHYGTALEYAAINGRATTISLLLARGADPNIIAGFDETALRAAVGREYDAMAQELLKAGADAKTGGVLHLAAEKGNDNAIHYLLDAGAEIDALAGFHGTALQTAVVFDRESTVRLLVERGADPKVSGGFEGNAVNAAVKKGNMAIVKLLLAKGKK
ncbi:hypothetical protein GP486_000588 [Trichoglossum hirsutum]|uniref:Azaphilone pigments biosynthesis cluster protein L N-terminal domain-containing protein n=1 Tax=Trichoglossum hirsutum TaxID=265104 RepID=A0A9P8LIA9_9PEZI|nr:hypothetical protein GP486_000588 [Trichoglossum hirsutum]